LSYAEKRTQLGHTRHSERGLAPYWTCWFVFIRANDEREWCLNRVRAGCKFCWRHQRRKK